MSKATRSLMIVFALGVVLLSSCATVTPSLDVYQTQYDPTTDHSVAAILDEFGAVDAKIPGDLVAAWNIEKKRIAQLQPYRTIFMRYNGDNSADINANAIKSGRLQIASLIVAGVTTASGVVAATWPDSPEVQVASKGLVIVGGIVTIATDAFNAVILKEARAQKEADDRNKATKTRIDESVALIHNQLYLISTLDKEKNKAEILGAINEINKDIDNLERAYLDAGLIRTHL